MKNVRYLQITLISLLILAFSACENLFESGLGEAVDVEPPTVSISSHVDGDFIGLTESFGGTFGDDLGTPELQISLVPLGTDGTSPTPEFSAVDTVDAGSGQWSHDIDTTALSDGEHELRVRATDGADRRTDAKAVVRVDNNPSVILVTSPNYGTSEVVNGTVTITGEAYDMHGVRSVELSITATPTGGDPVTVTGTASGTTVWSFDLDTEELGGTPLITTDGAVSITITATDRAGNVNSVLYHARDLQETTGTLPSAEEVFRSVTGDGPFALTPSVTIPTLDLSVDQSLDDPQFELTQPVETIAIDPLDLANPRGALNPNASPAEVLGAIADDDGILTGDGLVQIQIADYATFQTLDPDADADWTDIPAGRLSGSGERINWSWDVTGEDQGIWRARLRVKEQPEPGETVAAVPWTVSPTYEFALDAGAPTIVRTTAEETTPFSVPFTVEGSASDGFEVSRVEVTYDTAAPFTWQQLDATEAPGLGTTSTAWAREIDPATLGDGEYTATFRVADPGNRTDTVEYDFSVDVQGPGFEDVSIPASPVPTVNGILEVSGRAVDLSGIDSVWAWTGPNGVAPPPAPTFDAGSGTVSAGDWNAVTLTTPTNWSYTLDTTGGSSDYDDGSGPVAFDTGSFTLHLTAVDNAGNVSAVESRDFDIDDATDLPVITLTNIQADATDPADNTVNSTFQVFGEVTDDDLVDAASIEVDVSSDAGATWDGWVPVTDPDSVDSARVGFRHTINGATDGEYRLRFRASDRGSAKDGLPSVETVLLGAAGSGGLGGDQGIPVSVDVGPPTLAVTAPAAGTFANGDVTVTGTASDGNAVSSVTVTVGTGGTPQAVTDTASGGDPAFSTWEYLIDVSALGLGDGSVPVTVVARDPAGKTGQTSFTVSLDTVAPTVSVASPTAGSTLNDLVPFVANAGDSNVIDHVWYSVQPDGTTPGPVGGSDWDNATRGTQWTFSVDTRVFHNFDSAADFDVFVAAEDAAGNVTAPLVVHPITIDQSTDIPTVEIVGFSGTPTDNVVSAADVITVGATDDDAVAAIEWSTDDGTTWTTVDTTGASDPTDVTVTLDVAADLGLAEGTDERSLAVRAVDNDTSGGAARESAVVSAGFFVDDNPPSLAESAVGTSTEQIVNAPLVLTGTAADSTGLAELRVRVNGGTPNPVSVDGSGDWTITVPDDVGGGDGSYELVLTAEDVAGRTTSITRRVLVDTVAPDTPAITPPVGSFVTSSLSLAGTTGDAGSGVATVEYSLDGGGAGSWIPLSGTDNWFGTADVSGRPEGTDTVQVRVTDRAGNVSAVDSLNYVIDRTDPSVTVNGLTGTTYRSADFTVDGTVGDTLDLGAAPVSVAVTRDAGGGPVPVDLSGNPLNVSGSGTSRSWSQTVPIDAGDGEYLITVTATDAVGRTREVTRTVMVDTGDPTVSVSNVAGDGSTLVNTDTYTVLGTATDAATAVESVEYSLDYSDDGDDGNDTWLTASGTSSWSVPLSGLTDTLAQRIAVRARDAAGNTGAPVVADFQVDLADPTLSIDTGLVSPGLAYRNNSVTFDGSANDGNGVAEVAVTYSFNGGAAETLVTDTTDDGVWAATLDLNGPDGTNGTADDLADGEYQFTITATDGVGRTRTLQRTVWIDRAAPVAEFTSVSPTVDGDTINGKVTVRATVAEDLSLERAEWTILPDGDTPVDGDYRAIVGSRTAPVFDIDTTVATGNVTVNADGPFDVGFPNNATTVVWLRAIDRAGNTTEISRGLMVDQSSDEPRIALTTLDADADTPAESSLNLVESNALVRFVVEDDDAVDAGSIEISVGDSASWETINYGGLAAPSDATSVTTRHDLYTPSQLAEGTTMFYLRVSDSAAAKDGLAAATTTLGPVYIMVDRNFPTVTETGIGAAEVFRSAGYSLSGEIADTNALASLTVTETVNGGTATQILTTSPGGTNDTWTVNSLPTGGVSDGIYDYVVTVEDASGKQTSVSRRVTIDTTDPSIPSVTSIGPGDWVNAVTTVFSGSTDDGPSGSGVETVYWAETADGTAAPAFPGAAWTAVSVNPSDDSWSTPVEAGAPGLRTLHLIAEDGAGNTSATGAFDFGVDPSVPVLGFSGGSGTQYENGDFTIAGSFTDISGLETVAVEVSTNNVDFVPAGPATAAVDNGNGTFTWSRTLSGESDGVRYYRFVATDRAGNSAQATRVVNLDRSAPGITFSASAPNVNDSFDAATATATANGTVALTGTVSEDQGVANLETLEYRIAGGSWQALTVGNSFTVDPIDTTGIDPDGLGAGTGTLGVDIRAADRNGNETTESFTFTVDDATDLPVVSIGSPADGDTIATGSTTVSGSVSDDDGLSGAGGSLEYRFSEDGTVGGFGPWLDVPVDAGTPVPFSFVLSSASNGNKLLEMRGTDEFGTVSETVAYALTFDTSEPDFSGLAPTEDTYFNGDFALSGTVSDDSGDVTLLQYRVERDGTQIFPAAPGTWEPIAGVPASSVAFNETIDTSAGNGVYEVFLQAADGSGNTRETSISVFVDVSDPTLTVQSPVSATTVNNTITVRGEATDNFGVAASSDNGVVVEVVDVGDSDTDGDTDETFALGTGVLQPFTANTTVMWEITGIDTRDATLLSRAIANPDGDNPQEYELRLRTSVTDLAGNQTGSTAGSDYVLRIDQTTDRPTVTINDIASDGSSTIQTTTISGTVTDDDGVDGIVVDAWDAGNTTPTPDTTETVTLTSGSFGGTDLDWRVTLSDGTNGLRAIRVRAVDTVDDNGANYGATDWSRTDTGKIDFRLDTENPDLAITTPTVGTAWSGNDAFTVTGTAGDENGITALVYKVDDGDLSAGTTPVAVADPWSFTIPETDLADGPRTIYVQATDAVGNTTQRSVSITVDTTAPTISVTSPVAGTAVFGPLTINGTAADLGSGAQGVDAVSVGLGRQIDATSEATLAASTWISVPGTTSWSYDFLNINDYANSTFSVNTGDLNGDGVEDPGESWTNLWDFTFYVRAVDNAGTGGGGVSGGGNTAYLTSYTVQIDPLRDRPEVSILSPSDGATVGGSLRVFGSAFDSQFVEKVQIAIDANNNGDYTDDTWSEGVLDETDPDGTRWYLANGTTSWNVRLNDAGEFDPTGGSSTNTIRFKVRAKDYKVTPGDGIFGAEEEFSVTFNRDFPQFDGFNLVTGETVGGTVVWTGIIRDESNIERIDFTNESPLLNSTIVFENPGGLLPPPASGNVTGLATSAAASAGMTVELLAQDDPDYDAAFPGSYRVSIPIDTTAPGLYPGGAGSMSVRLVAEDSTTPSPFTNQAPLSLNVDNVLPSSLTYTGDAEILGSSAELRGSVRDSGTVSGIERVYVYLTDPTGALIRLQGGSGSVASGSFSPAAVLDPNDSTWDDYRMVIDNRLEEGNDGGAAGDADGIPEFLTISAGDYLWSGQFDSTLVPDGVVTVNVTAEDFAGNRSSTTVERFVANNRPLIDSVVLGTDLDGDGSIAASERSTPLTSGYGATGFTARNNRLLFDIGVSGGNGTLRYSVRYDADGDTVYEPSEELNATLTNAVLTVDTSSIPDSALNGAVFEVHVYDSTTSDDADSTDELSDVITIGLTIDNIDDVAPTVDVAPFGERYSESASDAAKVLQAVTEFEENVVVSGGGTLLGHVDYAADSVFHNPSADADLSGEVVFLGRVADNQRVDRIEVAITGYDPDGAGAAAAGDAFTVYDASTTGAQSDTDWAFELDGANYLTDTDGNVFNWRFSWNTASHASVVDRDVVLTVTAFDAATTPNTQSSQIQFDIVPYISGVSTDTTGIRDRNIRSASGRYSVARGNAAEHITITGFNLDPIANGVRIGSDTDGLNDGDGVTLEGTSLTVDVQGSPFTELRVRNDADRSGFLSVVTGTTGAPIPTLNNTNDNALPRHQEPSDQANNPNLTDDRYLRFFDVTSTSYLNAGFPEMMMDVATGDTPVFGYIDKSAANDLQLRRDNTGIVRSLNMTHGAMARDDDGRYYHVGTNDFSGGNLELFYDEYASFYTSTPYGANSGAVSPYWSNYSGNLSTEANNNALTLDELNYDGVFFSNRYLYPKLEARGRSNTPGEFATLYMTYYDARDAELVFRDARFGHTETVTELFNGSAAYSDVGTNMPNASPTSGDGDRHLVTGTASEYFDMAVTSGNQVVIIYYNQAATQLEMVYSTNVIDGDDTPTWSAPLSLGSLFSGTYVSMFIDDSDRIHVAAYDSAGADLRYFFLESINDTTPESVLVDANNSVGLWTEIGMNAAGELHIAYYNNSENGTRDSIKLARYQGTLPTVLPGVNGSGEATGDWEFMTVPTNSVPQGGLVQFNKVDVEFDSSGQPVVGYLGSNLEYARILPEVP